MAKSASYGETVSSASTTPACTRAHRIPSESRCTRAHRVLGQYQLRTCTRTPFPQPRWRKEREVDEGGGGNQKKKGREGGRTREGGREGEREGEPGEGGRERGARSESKRQRKRGREKRGRAGGKEGGKEGGREGGRAGEEREGYFGGEGASEADAPRAKQVLHDHLPGGVRQREGVIE
eukprot:812426-Rhodomonas_salina.1